MNSNPNPDYAARKAEYYKELPIELVNYIESLAYDRGHAYGQDEVDLIAGNMASDMIEYWQKLKTRKGLTSN